MKNIYLLFVLLFSVPLQANNSGVEFTVTNVTQGDTSDTISFQIDSCVNCISGSSDYQFFIDHTPISGGEQGSPNISFSNDSSSCIITKESYTITNQYLMPELDSTLDYCSVYSFTTHIQINNLKVSGGEWTGGDLNCKVTLSGIEGFDCGTIFVPAPSSQSTDIAKDLTAAYNAEPLDCGDDTKPAILCSGVLIRGTQPSENYHSWDPSPASISSGGTSFSYLRKDSKYQKLAYGYTNGLIFFPQQLAPTGKLVIPVLCSFPIDADTNNRADKGCGVYTGHPESDICQSQGIFNSNDWYKHYAQYNSQHTSQCGFDLRQAFSGSSIANAFNATISSMATIANESFNTQNEIRLQTWSTGVPTQLPIQAFFYIKGSTGLTGAQHDQEDFYNTTNGQIVPIIQLELPDTEDDDVLFSYAVDDQVVSISKKS